MKCKALTPTICNGGWKHKLADRTQIGLFKALKADKWRSMGYIGPCCRAQLARRSQKLAR
jgi:hypothetical protein